MDLKWNGYVRADSLRRTIHRRTKILRRLILPGKETTSFREECRFAMSGNSHGKVKPSDQTRFERDEMRALVLSQHRHVCEGRVPTGLRSPFT